MMHKKLIPFIAILALSYQSFAQKIVNGQPARYYKTLSNDGAWCWFSDPRAVSLNSKIYTGWVSKNGSIMVASYNEKTRETNEVNISSHFNKDDHANPSFLILPDKRIMVFFSSHSRLGNGEEVPATTYAISKNPEDITSWETQQKITDNIDGPMGFCYTNPIMLSKEKNRIYLFWRGGNWKPTFCYTDNFGKTWSKSATLLTSTTTGFNRPYIKISSNGKDDIHFAFTDGHPRNEPLNSIYYFKYKKGKFYKANGTIIGDLNNLPVKKEFCDIVYNAAESYKKTAFGVRSWIWDVAVDTNGNPTMVYTQLPEETTHHYYYAKWNGKSWMNSKISNAGSAFPRFERKKESRDPEPHYSGGISLDHENTNIVYYSKPVNDIFEIFKATTTNHGKTWSHTAITTNSKKDNVRPFAVRGSGEHESSQLLWMFNEKYEHYTKYDTKIKIDKKREKLDTELSQKAVKSAMKLVADWQINEKLRHNLADWTNAALYAGMVEWAKIANDSSYFDYLRDKGDKSHWAQLKRTNPFIRYHADDYAVGQMYIEMYRVYNEGKMIKPLQNYLDFILKYPSNRSLSFKWDNPKSLPIERWAWCDALFMAPTVWAKMAKELKRDDYLKFMHKEYLFTYDYLFDEDEDLFFRDDKFFAQKEANGAKVFWGRGNGWVIGGLPTIIEEVPANWSGKIFYETLFVKMAAKIASIQDKNGYWHASMLDPDSYPNPETSSSAFFTYALAWGVNNNYLDKSKYQPVVEKGWKALVRAVYPDGKLGWVQPIGENPKNVTQEMTEVYGVGAFLLAGTEVYKMVK